MGPVNTEQKQQSTWSQYILLVEPVTSCAGFSQRTGRLNLAVLHQEVQQHEPILRLGRMQEPKVSAATLKRTSAGAHEQHHQEIESSRGQIATKWWDHFLVPPHTAFSKRSSQRFLSAQVVIC
jgi:hypothetical protein